MPVLHFAVDKPMPYHVIVAPGLLSTVAVLQSPVSSHLLGIVSITVVRFPV